MSEAPAPLKSIVTPVRLEYDSWDRSAAGKGAYTAAVGRRRRGSGEASRIAFDLPRGRFANRQRGGADFRIRVRDVRTAIRRIDVRIVNR